MVTIKDILIQLSVVFLWFFSSITIAVLTELHFLLFSVFIAFVCFKVYLKRRKKILHFVKDDFQKIGYLLNSERPITFKEYFRKVKLEAKPIVFINDISLSRYRYMRAFRRIFTAKSKNGSLVELNTFVIYKWNGENKIEIIDIKRFRN
jgi:hypothetical protein